MPARTCSTDLELITKLIVTTIHTNHCLHCIIRKRKTKITIKLTKWIS